MFTTLLKELEGKDSKLFILRGGSRLPLSDCSLKIRIYEDRTELATLGGNAKVKTYHAAIAICSDINKRVDVNDIDKGYFEIQTSIETGYNQRERVLLDQLAAVELDSLFEWTFEIIDKKMIKKLLNM